MIRILFTPVTLFSIYGAKFGWEHEKSLMLLCIGSAIVLMLLGYVLEEINVDRTRKRRGY